MTQPFFLGFESFLFYYRAVLTQQPLFCRNMSKKVFYTNQKGDFNFNYAKKLCCYKKRK